MVILEDLKQLLRSTPHLKCCQNSIQKSGRYALSAPFIDVLSLFCLLSVVCFVPICASAAECGTGGSDGWQEKHPKTYIECFLRSYLRRHLDSLNPSYQKSRLYSLISSHTLWLLCCDVLFSFAFCLEEIDFPDESGSGALCGDGGEMREERSWWKASTD